MAAYASAAPAADRATPTVRAALLALFPPARAQRAENLASFVIKLHKFALLTGHGPLNRIGLELQIENGSNCSNCRVNCSKFVVNM